MTTNENLPKFNIDNNEIPEEFFKKLSVLCKNISDDDIKKKLIPKLNYIIDKQINA